MPIDVIRFGAGHRRPEGPPGTHGIHGQVIHGDARGSIAELAFSSGAVIEPHTNPNTTWFIVIEGGGWVLVGEERLRVAAGEAVVWPAGIVHGAWTDLTEMRVLLVELAGEDDALVRGLLPGEAHPVLRGEPRASRGEGHLAAREPAPERIDRSSGEPA